METEVTAGLSPGTSTLRIRVSFYSVFNLPERSVRASGQFVPGRLRLSYTISFFRLFRYTLEIIFKKFFHVPKPTLDCQAHHLFVHAFGPGNVGLAHAEDEMGVDTLLLFAGQAGNI